MFKKHQIETKLDEEILVLLEQMGAEDDKTSETYAKKIAQFSTLHELRHKSRISVETLATLGANMLGIVVILNHERAHVIASKAFSLVKKIV